jgi:O-methyltransferase involved in polyketide biosynthesis
MRSRIFDDAVQRWLAKHPDGTVVELGAGLETQFSRVDNGRVHWLCVDVPEAIAVRERFLPASERCLHLQKSVLDLSWLDAVATDGPVFVSAQGLFMYFEVAEVKRLFVALFERFPGMELMFDCIPRSAGPHRRYDGSARLSPLCARAAASCDGNNACDGTAGGAAQSAGCIFCDAPLKARTS